MALSESPQAPTIGILTVSDRAFSGTYTDRGGPAIQSYLKAKFNAPFETKTKIVPDEKPQIEEALREMCKICCLVLTTGGTGPAPRDVTPEATIAVCEKMLPGFGEIMRAESIRKVPTAILSRQTAGILGTSLIINLPGSPKAIAECMEPVKKAIPHAIRIAGSTQQLVLKDEKDHLSGKCPCGSDHGNEHR